MLFGLLGLLIVTGYLLYYPPDEEWLPTVAWVHWGVGLAMVMPFVVHRFWHSLSRRHRGPLR